MRHPSLLLLVLTTACIGGGKSTDDDDDGGGDGGGDGGWDVDTDTDTDAGTDGGGSDGGGSDGGGTDGGDTDTDGGDSDTDGGDSDTDGGDSDTDGGDSDTDTDGGTEPATGFAAAATAWDVPDFDAGGYGINTSGQYYYSYGSWALYDMNGDGAADLVHMADAGSPLQAHGYDDGDQEWWVFFSTGSGFEESATVWDVPDIDAGGYGINTGDQYYYSYGSWSVIDLTGDGRPDLVHMAPAGSPLQVHGYDGDAHWDVYENNGSGFARSASSWDVPDIDAGGYGLNTSAQYYYSYGSWGLYDMDADGRPDLVHMAPEGSPLQVHGYGGSPHWNVYRNTGSGFRSSPATWDVPDIDAGGYGINTGSQYYYSYGSWGVLDVTGDERPDLVHMAPAGSPLQVHGYGDDHYWDVYENVGSDFAGSAVPFDVPDDDAGGYGFNNTGQYYYSYGSWAVLDMGGDGFVDFVHMAPAGSPLQVFGYGDDASWDVYAGDGTGFATSAAGWQVPDDDAGGYGFNSASQYYYSYGSWGVVDLTGDGAPDFVHMAPAGSPLEVFGHGGDATWQVYAAE